MKGVDMMGRMRKRSVFALAVALIFMLAACSGGSGSNNNDDSNGDGGSKGKSDKDQIELSFWTLGNVNYEDLAKEYMADHPNIRITVQNTGDQTAHHNNLTTALSAGSGAPDIFQLEIAFMERYISAQDKFHNLNDLGAKDVKDMYLDWKWEQASSVDGSFQIGLPTDIGPTVAYYRTDLFEQAGLTSDPDGVTALINTWDKFASTAKKFTDETGKPFVDSRDLIYNAIRDQSDGEIYFSKADGSFIGDQNPQVRKAYDMTVQGIQQGWVGSYGLWAADWNQGMNDGFFAVVPGPAWMLGNIKDNGQDASGKWRIAQLPEGSGNWGGSFLTLPKEGKHAKEAYAFIEWLVNKDNQITSFKDKGLMPTIPDIYDEPEFKDYTDEYLGGQASAVEFGKAANRVKPVYYGPLHDQTDAYIKEALQNVQEQGADPKAEWDAAIAKIKRLIERS